MKIRRSLALLTMLCLGGLAATRAADRPKATPPPESAVPLSPFNARSPAKAPDLSNQPGGPILRIEANMHTAAITALSSDAAGRFGLTMSKDKTARLWEIPTGRLLRILRPPVGEGVLGRISAGALSPDGALAAVGVSHGKGADENQIDLFDSATGRLVRRVEGLPYLIDLAFSRDGRYLAAALGLKRGLRVFDSLTGREVGRDEEYGYTCMSVDWAPDGRLVTVSGGPILRIYHARPHDRSRTPIPWRPALEEDAGQDGLVPMQVRFSPDGGRIAVGFEDYTTVSVYDGRTLAHLFAPDSQGLPGGKGWGGLHSLAWSTDGSTIAAGGGWHDEHHHLIRRWNQAGRSRGQDSAAASNTLTGLRSLPDGSFLLATENPLLGLLLPSGKLRILGNPPIADFRSAAQNNRGPVKGPLDAFVLSDDAMEVGFGLESGGKPPARFSLSTRNLELLDPAAWPARLHLPRITGLAIESWQDSHFAELDGRPLEIGKEYSQCLAIARDTSCFLLGTQLALYCFDPKGRQRWKQLSTGGTWAAGISADGKLGVAALEDGTIRWYRMRDGKELLALFPHADGKRWVAWTPEGYYDASPGGEDIVGWHVNRGDDQPADFFPASRFRAVYYRPDVIARVLKTSDGAEALRAADSALGRPATKPEGIREVIARLSPPVVSIVTGGIPARITIRQDASSVPVEYSVRATGPEAPTEISVRFNGRPVEVAAPIPAQGALAKIEVPIPDGAEGEISILATHRFGAGEAALLQVRREGEPGRARLPDLYLLACGVAHLKANQSAPAKEGAEGALFFPELNFAGEDARKFSQLFDAAKGRVFGHVFPTVLVDQQATNEAIGRALAELQRKARPGDVAIVFFSGHGHYTPQSGFMLITHDADPRNLVTTALTGETLARQLSGIRASVILALDTCHSGAALEGQRAIVTGPGDLTGLANQLSSAEQGVVVLSSSAEDQQSLEDQAEGVGFFTKAFAEGFIGRAAKGGLVTCASMQQWLTKRVPELVREIAPERHDLRQTPVCILPKGVPDFALARIEGAVAAAPVRSADVAAMAKRAEPLPVASIETPKDVILHLLEWSGGAEVEPDQRLRSCFADEVDYFSKKAGQKLGWMEIARDSADYNRRFTNRKFTLLAIHAESKAAKGDVTLRYEMRVECIEKTTGRVIDKPMNTEAALRSFGGQWKIIRLRALPK